MAAVDEVAFIRPEHGDAIAAELERRKIHKSYYLETRADVLLRNEEVFQRWRRLGLKYLFLASSAWPSRSTSSSTRSGTSNGSGRSASGPWLFPRSCTSR